MTLLRLAVLPPPEPEPGALAAAVNPPIPLTPLLKLMLLDILKFESIGLLLLLLFGNKGFEFGLISG